MPEHDDFYTPAHIDEQIDALLQTRTMPARDLRLADDLRAILEHENENARSLRIVRQKLMEDTSEQPAAKVVSITEKQQQGRSVVMQKSPFPSPKRASSSLIRMWSTLAAVLVVAVLVGSMLLVLNSVHQPKSGLSSASHSNPTATTATPAPTLQEGQIIYTSEKIDINMPVVWSPDGKRVATAINHATVESWDAQTGKNIVTYHVAPYSNHGELSKNAVSNVAWSPDGSKLLVAQSNTIYLFNASTARLIRTLQPTTTTADGAFITSLLVFTRGAGQQAPLSATLPLSGSNFFGNAVWSPNGQYIAAMYNTGGAYNVRGMIDIWNATSGSLVKTFSGFTSNGISVSWSSQENRLAAIGYDNTITTVKVWDTGSWNIIKQYPNITAFDWSPDGTQLALVGTDKTGQGTNNVNLVDATSGNTVRQFTDPQATSIQALHWSPDGNRLALEITNKNESDALSIDIWSATSGTLLYTFPQKGVYEATWSPNSKYISCSQIKEPGKKNNSYMLIITWVA